MYIDDTAYYIKDLAVFRQLSENTQKAYRRDLEKLGRFADSRGIRSSVLMDRPFLEEFLRSMSDDGASESSMRRMISTLNGFFGSLKEQGMIPENYAEDLTVPEKKEPPASAGDAYILTVDEMTAVLNVPLGRGFSDLRNRVILGLLCISGVKSSELVGIRVRDVDFLLNTVRVTAQDGSFRHVPVGNRIGADIRRYINSDRKRFSSRSDFLFVNHDGQPLSRQGLWKIVRTLGEHAGIEGALTPARIRASLAVHLKNSGNDEERIRHLLGLGRHTSRR